MNEFYLLYVLLEVHDLAFSSILTYFTNGGSRV